VGPLQKKGPPYRFEEKARDATILTEEQNFSTTKDTKSTKEQWGESTNSTSSWLDLCSPGVRL